MLKIILLITIIASILNAKDSLSITKQQVLYVQNLIKLEEKIAYEYEKYLLTQFSIPSIDLLLTDTYMGANFSKRNILGDDIDFKTNDECLNREKICLNIAINKMKFKKDDIKKGDRFYISELYKRDVYRDKTSVIFKFDKDDKIKFAKSYIQINLKSDEAKKIYKILKSKDKESKHFIIKKTCDGEIKSKYCVNDLRSIRWYNKDGNWIEYDKNTFEDGNVTIKNTTLLNDDKLKNLAIGAFVYINDGSKYIKLIDDIFRKVD